MKIRLTIAVLGIIAFIFVPYYIGGSMTSAFAWRQDPAIVQWGIGFVALLGMGLIFTLLLMLLIPLYNWVING